MSAQVTRVLLPAEELESRIGYQFKNKVLLKRALTHRSFASEHNERLEFLGDSVLNCVIGHALFLRDRHFTEGVLSRVRSNLVCEKALDEIAALSSPEFAAGLAEEFSFDLNFFGRAVPPAVMAAVVAGAAALFAGLFFLVRFLLAKKGVK